MTSPISFSGISVTSSTLSPIEQNPTETSDSGQGIKSLIHTFDGDSSTGTQHSQTGSLQGSGMRGAQISQQPIIKRRAASKRASIDLTASADEAALGVRSEQGRRRSESRASTPLSPVDAAPGGLPAKSPSQNSLEDDEPGHSGTNSTSPPSTKLKSRGLQRSHNVAVKKRVSNARKMSSQTSLNDLGTASNSQAQVIGQASVTSTVSGSGQSGITQQTLFLKSSSSTRSNDTSTPPQSALSMNPDYTDKVKQLFRNVRFLQNIADELCRIISAAWSNALTSNDFQLDMVNLFCKDLMSGVADLIAALPQEVLLNTQPLRKTKAEFEFFCKTSLSMETSGTFTTGNTGTGSALSREKEAEIQKVTQKLYRLCHAVVGQSVALISELCRVTSLVPIMSVQGWKIESVSHEYMRYWLPLSGCDKPTDGEVERDLQEEAVSYEDELGSKRNRRRSNRLDRAKAQNEIYINAKQQHLVTAKMMYDHVRVQRSFAASNKLEVASNGLVSIPLEHFEFETLAYRRFFLGQDHRNYVGVSDKFGEIAISVKREPLLNASGQQVQENDEPQFQFRVLVRAKQYSGQLLHLLIPENEVYGSFKLNLFSNKKEEGGDNSSGNERAWKSLLNQIHPKLDVSRLRRIDVSPNAPPSLPESSEQVAAHQQPQPSQEGPSKIEKSMLQLDEHRTAFQYKFGLMYVRDGQQNETEWFDNTQTSKSFNDFCSLLGDTIALAAHKGFTGGLDTKRGNTGELSIYTKWRYDTRNGTASAKPKKSEIDVSEELEFEIMYHVSTLLPYTPGDEQQIQRKRHIGNDLVSLVFLDKPLTTDQSKAPNQTSWQIRTPFDPRQIRSQFLHVYIVVQEVMVENCVLAGRNLNDKKLVPAYRVYTTSNVDVPNYTPSLPDPPVFPIQTQEDKQRFRDFIISKMISSENAAFEAPKFKSLHTRTYLGLMETLIKEHGSGSSSVAMTKDHWQNLKSAMASGAVPTIGRKASRGISFSSPERPSAASAFTTNPTADTRKSSVPTPSTFSAISSGTDVTKVSVEPRKAISETPTREAPTLDPALRRRLSFGTASSSSPEASLSASPMPISELQSTIKKSTSSIQELRKSSSGQFPHTLNTSQENLSSSGKSPRLTAKFLTLPRRLRDSFTNSSKNLAVSGSATDTTANIGTTNADTPPLISSGEASAEQSLPSPTTQ